MIKNKKKYYNKNKYRRGKNKSIEYSLQSKAAKDVVQRYGSANKEYIVSYSGRDNEANRNLKRGLKRIHRYKVNCKYYKENIKQQAGFVAEEIYTARENSKRIISGDKRRIRRTDDLGSVNDQLYDHFTIDTHGNIIVGSGEQMKFVGNNAKELFDALKSGKFRKYLGKATITVPSDYYEGVISEIEENLSRLEDWLKNAEKRGNKKLIERYRNRIFLLKKIKTSIKDSGITTKEAILARQHPLIFTIKDMTKISHQAGMVQAKMGISISAAVSLIRNVVALCKNKKKPIDAAKELAVDTGEGALVAYLNGFGGSFIKAGMQNSSNEIIRGVSKSNAPAMMVTSAIDVGKSLTRLCKGEISIAECLSEMGEKGTGYLNSALFATIGQMAIPVPIIGAMSGSIIGYTLNSIFYKELKTALKEAEITRIQRIVIEQECQATIKQINKYREEMKILSNVYFNDRITTFNSAFSCMDKAFYSEDIDDFIMGANMITKKLGQEVQFSTMQEFNVLMRSEQMFNF
ncbi:hypothetical protein B5F77_13040 [Parabacteroides sp. An277]|uniref:hypothetical protein n=1 Tax=Parabacteroides sp. An277 TaxID=1965619 RepID=UPI000B398443|nr:hypothetical protein [Parabacteroides sp. An277]OUO50353.1 hypothetical protein B5F77_13040 [Parabacteroides sp. An277]